MFRRASRVPLVLIAGLLLVSGSRELGAQARRPFAPTLLKPYGLENFPPLYKEAINAFFNAKKSYEAQNYTATNRILTNFWKRHPMGTKEWLAARKETEEISLKTGANFGRPVCYCSLRMLTECVEWRLGVENGTIPKYTPEPVQWSIVLIGSATGRYPGNKQELAAGGGPVETHKLNPALDGAIGQAMIEEATWLFREYASAITKGRLTVQLNLIRLPELDIPAYVKEGFAGPAQGAMKKVWDTLPVSVKNDTDWWWLIHPSFVPQRLSDFRTERFVTGGMGRGPDRMSACFINDDSKLITKPGNLGKGLYTHEERQAYFPSWFHHEFFHHIFSRYPSEKLEVTGHQWFDRSKWPSDFEGEVEQDHHAEAMHKRFQTGRLPDLNYHLRYAKQFPGVQNSTDGSWLVGDYARTPAENGSHQGRIEYVGQENGVQTFVWKSKNGDRWGLKLNTALRSLETSPENKHFKQGEDDTTLFKLILRRKPSGEIPDVIGFRFLGEEYLKQR